MNKWVSYNEHDELVRAMQQIAALEKVIDFLVIGATACAIPHAGERKVLQEAVDMARALSTEHGQSDIVDDDSVERYRNKEGDHIVAEPTDRDGPWSE